MKVTTFILLMLISSCGKLTLKESTNLAIGNDLGTGQVIKPGLKYSALYAPTPFSYQSFTFYDDGTMEHFAMKTRLTGGTYYPDGYYKAVGTYTKVGSNLSYSITFTEADISSNFYCGLSGSNIVPYVETPTTMTFSGSTYELESVSGLSEPDYSAFPNVCP